MNSTDPHSTVEVALSDIAQAKYVLSATTRSILSVLVIAQALLTFRYSNAYWELLRTGAVSPLAWLIGAPATLCLYGATVSAILLRAGAKVLFLCAAIGLAVAYPLWTWHYSWSVPIAFGALIAIGGWWAVIRAANRVEQPAPFR